MRACKNVKNNGEQRLKEKWLDKGRRAVAVVDVKEEIKKILSDFESRLADNLR